MALNWDKVSYLKELRGLCDEIFAQFSLDTIDLVFVDLDIHLRGDLVNIMMEKNIPIVAAHDTNPPIHSHRFDKVTSHPQYKVFHFSKGAGLTLWVRKDCHDVIRCLQKTDCIPNGFKK